MGTTEDTLRQYASRVEDRLADSLPDETTEPVRLHAAMRYSTLGGGKRVRAALVYATGQALDSPLERLDPPACAVELIHAFSLVHDDMPCMDDDDLRRGRPTCHKAYDEPTALLVGDALQTLAFDLLARLQDDGLPPRQQLEMIRDLTLAAGSLGMAGGQALDIEATGGPLNLEQLVNIHERKTGALIRASVMMGARAADCTDSAKLAALSDFGHAVGLAFQIVDDILDVTSDTDTLGKPQGSDAAANKLTYPAMMGLDAARQRAGELVESALASLAPLGDNGQSLAEIAGFILRRQH